MKNRVNETSRVGNGQCAKLGLRTGFTLVELLVVVSIISMLVAILVPSINMALDKANSIKNISNQRTVSYGLNLYSNDNSDWFPHSIGLYGKDPRQDPYVDPEEDWQWDDPRRITGFREASAPRTLNGGFRSMSAYLKDYIPTSKSLQCTNAPSGFDALEQAWDEGDDWVNPVSPTDDKPLTGTYCFWWRYRGCLTKEDSGDMKVFKGPARQSGGRGYSKMLMSDYFGSHSYRTRLLPERYTNKYGSCEVFDKSTVLASDPSRVHADYYYGGDADSDPLPTLKLNAAFVDGHVESFTSDELVTLEVSSSLHCTKVFHPDVGKGKFYIPLKALR